MNQKIRVFFFGGMVSVPLALAFIKNVGTVSRVEGISMQPTLNPQCRSADYVFLSKRPKHTKNIQRGDIVVLTHPKKPEKSLIKRVIGLAGDVISTNGYKLDVVEIPEGHCWVEGDHSKHSLDSNYFGPVSCNLIEGKAVLIVWPPNRWRSLQNLDNLQSVRNLQRSSLTEKLNY